MSPKLNFGIAVIGYRYRQELVSRRGSRSPWIDHNVLANKLARIAWSVLAHGRTFEASKIQAA